MEEDGGGWLGSLVSWGHSVLTRITGVVECQARLEYEYQYNEWLQPPYWEPKPMLDNAGASSIALPRLLNALFELREEILLARPSTPPSSAARTSPAQTKTADGPIPDAA